MPKNSVFVHGKAGVIEMADGTKTSFLGSANETKSGFANNYEILWEDSSPKALPGSRKSLRPSGKKHTSLPDAIVEEIKRVADRVEIG